MDGNISRRVEPLGMGAGVGVMFVQKVTVTGPSSDAGFGGLRRTHRGPIDDVLLARSSASMLGR